jgi:Xaa-Pro aminopeptidase
VLAHGVGLCNEYPSIVHPEDWAGSGYDGVLEPNMVLSVESYVGAEGGVEGVKLEEQVVITPTGVERLSQFPFEDALLA